jgi:hypothetical protein
MRARPLHRYRMESYAIKYAERMDLHLLRFSGRLMLKPLPEYMLDYDFWETYICPDEELWKSAAGWLLSWLWLITTPLDLHLAKEVHLLPNFVDWIWWKNFVREFTHHVDINALGMYARWHPLVTS